MLEEEPRQGNRDVVAARAIGVTILLEVRESGLISEDIVCLCKSDKFLDSKWIVRILIGMHFERHLSVLLLDVSDGGIGRHLEDHEGIEGLKLFH